MSWGHISQCWVCHPCWQSWAGYSDPKRQGVYSVNVVWLLAVIRHRPTHVSIFANMSSDGSPGACTMGNLWIPTPLFFNQQLQHADKKSMSLKIEEITSKTTYGKHWVIYSLLGNNVLVAPVLADSSALSGSHNPDVPEIGDIVCSQKVCASTRSYQITYIIPIPTRCCYTLWS